MRSVRSVEERRGCGGCECCGPGQGVEINLERQEAAAARLVPKKGYIRILTRARAHNYSNSSHLTR